MSPDDSQPALDSHYEFFPSVRAGYRPKRKFGDDLNGRTTFGVELTVEGRKDGGQWQEAATTPQTDIRMYGPGDVSGIGPEQVVRVEPEPDTSTMPPNYFPLVELRRADLPWLFSPARANPDDDAKAQPWLCLVVVEQSEATIEAEGRKPNPSLTVPQTELPPLDEAWAWAHAQVVGRLSDTELEAVFTGQSTQAVARLLCPRNLEPNTRYVAALVPTFEPGRRVGLGKDPYESTENQSIEPAWDATKDKSETVPIYHQWEFATANKGDFESLVRKLEPRNLTDSGVGKREVDLSDPGPELLEDPSGTFEVGGALASPGLEQDPFPKTVRGEDKDKRLDLRQLLNRPNAVAGSNDPLPVVGPPVYGQWYLPPDAGWVPGEEGTPEPPRVPTGGRYFDAWIHELNVDPRWRIPAGYGTEVVQENQEGLMERAWAQFGDLERANQRVGRGQAGDLVGGNARDRFERSGRHAVGAHRRVRDIEELNRKLAASEATPDAGSLANHRTDPPVEDQITGLDNDRMHDGALSKQLLKQGKLDVDGPAANAGAGTDGKRVNELRLKGAGAMRGDGGGSITTDPTTAARFETLTSPTYRRLTRANGKLDRGVSSSKTRGTFTERLGEPFSFGTDEKLANRFAKGSTGTADGASTGSTGTEPDEQTAGSAGEETAPSAAGDRRAATAWRVDADGQVMTLSEAAARLDGTMATVPKALLSVESAQDHCEMARNRLVAVESELADAGEEFPRPVRKAVTERPTLEDQCAAIRDNTFDVLNRQFGKLVAGSPPPVDEDFTQAEKEARLDRARQAHRRLTTTVEYVTDAVRSQSDDPATVRDKVTEALGVVGDIKLALEELAEPIDRGVPAGPTGSVTSTESAVTDASTAGSQPLSLRTTPDRSGDQMRFMSTATSARQRRLFEGSGAYPGTLDASSWAKQRTARDVHSGLLDRELPLDRIVGEPTVEEPMYQWLVDLDEQYLLPGVNDIPADTIGALETNSEFIESFMCGLNHEMARELQWRRYPTDRRGTYFRHFWKYVGEKQPDIKELTEWRDSPLGSNRAPGITDDRVVMIIRGDLLRAYPNTRVYAVKAVKEDKSGTDSDSAWDRVPLLESLREKAIDQKEGSTDDSEELLKAYTAEELKQSAWDPKEPVFSGTLDPDITFLGFDLQTEMAVGGTLNEDTPKDELGWFFVLEERVGETRFGLDVPTRGDYGAVPHGIRTGPEGNRSNNEMDGKAYRNGAEKGWDALSWGHLVSKAGALDKKNYVSVTEDRPAGGDNAAPWAITEGQVWYSGSGADSVTETWDYEDAAEWGANSAHMAQITWQLPVRVCIHADDILPDVADEDSGWYRTRGTTGVNGS